MDFVYLGSEHIDFGSMRGLLLLPLIMMMMILFLASIIKSYAKTMLDLPCWIYRPLYLNAPRSSTETCGSNTITG